MKKREVLIRSILIAFTIYFFLLSIKLMGGAFKLFGKEFAHTLISITANPLVGLFIGILATSIVQSSSCTTSIVVGLTASGALTIGNAVPIIMGANIGTSVTNTIVSLGHVAKRKEFRKAFEVATVHDFFNFIVVIILFPIELLFHPLEKAAVWFTTIFLGANMGVTFTSPLNHIIKPAAGFLEWLLWDNAIAILALALLGLFFSLKYFVKIIKPIAQGEFRDHLNKHIFNSPARAFGTGLILTTIVQSSSVSTSLIVPLAGVGLLMLDKVFPYILGANIGTTFTALMASVVTGSPAAVAVALEHVMFNTFGSIIIWPLRRFPIALSRGLAALSFRSRFYPFAYIASTFFIIPVVIIYLFH